MASSTGTLVKQGPLVLAVDDDASILRIIEMLLTRYGYTVRMAISAEKALEMLRTILPNVLISDVQMPGMSGYDLCQVVKRDKRLQNIPVIFLTGKDAPQDYKTGHDSGAVVYMIKPFKPEKLLQAVQLVAPVAQAPGEPAPGT